MFAAWISFGAAAFSQQTGASIDAGALNMRYADSITSNAIAITPSAWTESRMSSFRATGTFSEFKSGGWSAQGSGTVSLITPRVGFVLGEIEGNAGGSAHDDGSRTGQLMATGRAHLAAANRGIWLGAGAGSAWDGTTWRKVRQAEAAGWLRFEATTALAFVNPVLLEDSIRYTDTQIAGVINFRQLDLSASAGFRSGRRLAALGGTARSWGSLNVTGWFSSRFAMVASAGTYPVDPTQGYPGGRFVALGVRLGSRRSQPYSSDLYNPHPGLALVNPLEASRFDIRPSTADAREIRVYEPSARSVEIMGDFNDWRPVQLSRAESGWWSIALPVSKGIHEINVRVDGGLWVVPLGLPAKSDEFGGKVGIMVVR